MSAESKQTPNGMTVADAIKYLSALTDKSIVLMVDCPYCGKGCQLEKIYEAVILESRSGE
jgi:hypothetical protein